MRVFLSGAPVVTVRGLGASSPAILFALQRIPYGYSIFTGWLRRRQP